MTDSNQAGLAFVLAQHYHHGQVDKAGEPYIGHPARVAGMVVTAGFGDEVQAVAWLHDTVEDTALPLAAIGELFTSNVSRAVDAITHREGQSNADYYAQVIRNPLATVVKWYDLCDNSDPARLALIPDEATRERLTEKYRVATDVIGAAYDRVYQVRSTLFDAALLGR